MIYSLSLSLETFPRSNLLHWDYVNTCATKVPGKTEDACFTYRNTFSQIFFKKGVLKNFASFSEKELFWSLSLNIQAWRPAKEIPTQLFSLNFAKFLRTQFLQNNSSGSFFPHFATYFRSMPPFYTPLKASKYLWLSG